MEKRWKPVSAVFAENLKSCNIQDSVCIEQTQSILLLCIADRCEKEVVIHGEVHIILLIFYNRMHYYRSPGGKKAI